MGGRSPKGFARLLDNSDFGTRPPPQGFLKNYENI